MLKHGFMIFWGAVLLTSASWADCKHVRLADIGWTDVSATTALAALQLEKLGYTADISILALPVTLAALKNNDIDVFLGNWMPSQKSDIAPYLADRTVSVVRKNLSGAKFTIAVPDYVYDAGVHDITDIARFSKQFQNRIYGIEPGNDGNRQLLKMIHTNDFSLGDFHLVESSEQGMLVAVKNAISDKNWIAFLGWAPHPMNRNLSLRYLSGGDNYFGPNFGEAAVYTLARRGLEQECPELYKFFSELTFSVEQENELMSLITDGKNSPKQAAQIWLSHAPVQTLAPYFFPAWHYKIPIGKAISKGLTGFTRQFSANFRHFSTATERGIQGLTEWLLRVPPWIFTLLLCLVAYAIRRSILLCVGFFLGFMLIAHLDLWTQTIQTLVLVGLSTLISVALGIPLGIRAAHSPHLYAWMRPVLDLMQTIPTFVYLIPTLMLFGLGVVPGLISTVIFALPASIRLTHLGISKVPPELNEAAQAFGATGWQQLCKVELPYAKHAIVAGVSQTVMLSLSMVVIAALVGANGLGEPVVRALNTVDIAMGFEAGLVIVLLAILLDRLLRPSEQLT